MTLDKAIEILQERYRIKDPLKNPDYDDAIRLGIQALKAWKGRRHRSSMHHWPLLPGETED